MPDREKIIKGLDICINNIHTGCPRVCPYYEQCIERGNENVFQPIFRDALAMLKEQEDQIEQLEHDLAVTQNNLNYYVHGND